MGKVNTDEQPELAIRFGVMSIPTVIFLKDGKEIDRKVGVMPAGAFTQVLDQNPGGWDYLGQSQEFLYFAQFPQADGASPGYASAKEALLSWVRETVLSVPGVQPLSREEFQALSQGLDLFQKAAPAS